MKKILVCMLAFCVFISLVGCGKQSKSFELSDAQKMIVYSISGKKTEVTNTKVIQQLTDNIASIQFSRDKSSKNMNGFGPIVQWYDSDNNIIDAISVMDSQTIDYNGYYWIAKNGNIDMTLIDELLANRTIGEEISVFSYDEELAIYKDNSPGVKFDGFVNTSEFQINNEESAIERAKKECTIKYDIIQTFYDGKADVWKIYFGGSTPGNDETVYLDGNGITKLIIYGE